MRWNPMLPSILGGILLAGAAVAEDAPSRYDPKAAHAEADRNGDGQIDRQEFYVRMVEIFFHGDVDKDGFMKPEELNAVTLIEEDFSEADGDRDGRISLYEFIEVRYDDLEDADTDSNGRLSVEEVVAVFEASQPESSK
jgi:hypothetical protein